MVTTHENAASKSTEVEFRITDDDLFFVAASRHAGCRITLVEMVHCTDDRLLEFFTVQDTPPDDVLALAEGTSGIDDARLIRRDGPESLLEFVVSGPCIGATLADAGAIVRRVSADDGTGVAVAYVPAHADVRHVVETIASHHDVSLVAQRSIEGASPAFTSREFRETLADRLTARQLETLGTAFSAGYFDWPRSATAEECASALDISQPTFAQHLRRGESKLLETVFDDSQHAIDIN